MPTIKQERAFDKVVENGGNVSSAMREVGYSEATANTPQKLTESKGWKELMETYLSDDKLAQKHDELLNSGGIEKLRFAVTDDNETIKETVHAVAGCEVLYIRQGKDEKMAYVKVSDNQTQRAALDMAYKLKGSYAPDKSINVSILADPEQFDVIRTLAKQMGDSVKKTYDGSTKPDNSGDGNASGI